MGLISRVSSRTYRLPPMSRSLNAITTPPPQTTESFIVTNKSNRHSLGPWNRTKDIRLFSYHDRVYKIRVLLETEQPSNSSSTHLQNPQISSDIDRCIAKLLKEPPRKAIPTTYKPSENTTFIVELRSWKPGEVFIQKMSKEKLEVYPYSFKVSGKTKLPFVIESSIGEEGEKSDDSKSTSNTTHCDYDKDRLSGDLSENLDKVNLDKQAEDKENA